MCLISEGCSGRMMLTCTAWAGGIIMSQTIFNYTNISMSFDNGYRGNECVVLPTQDFARP